ncbi:MAG: hypothetical protein QXV17_13285 [Candidatus Micrarchaeaceae archaeon]
MKLIPFKFARVYHDLTYMFLITILIATAVIPAFAMTSGSVTLSLTNINSGAPLKRGAPPVYLSGTVIISGNYLNYSKTPFVTTSTQGTSVSGSKGNLTVSGSGQNTVTINGTTYYTEPAPIYLSGTATEYYMGTVNGVSTMENNTEPISFNNPYYTGQSADFTVYFPVSRITPPEYFTVSVEAKSANGELLATTATSNSPGGTIDLFNTIVALPLFNDSMLGAIVTHTGAGQPALPLGGIFNLLMLVSLIVLVFSVLFIFFVPQRGERPTVGSALAKVIMGVIVILLFPFIYDHIAELLNLLNQTIIAYPLPAPSYTVALDHVYASIIFSASNNIFAILASGVLTIAYAVVALIVVIMMYLVGTVRIFLLGGMIVMFPLSIALRDIPFTQKLGKIIEDTLFGLILATILSAVMLGVAGTLLMNWNTTNNIFVTAGIPSQWVAAAAVIVAILAPTVLAPLTSTVYQTTSQVAMAGGSVAFAVGSGAFTGGLGSASAMSGGGGLGGVGAATVGQVAATNMVSPATNMSWAERAGHVVYGAFLGATEAGLGAFGSAVNLPHGFNHVARKVGEAGKGHVEGLKK